MRSSIIYGGALGALLVGLSVSSTLRVWAEDRPGAPPAEATPVEKPTPVEEAATAEKPAVDEAQVAQWIKRLDHEELAVRRQATQDLIAAGADVIAPLTKAVQGESLEVTSRGIHVLARLMDKPETKAAAKAALETIAGAEQAANSAARRAKAVLEMAENAGKPAAADPPIDRQAQPFGLPGFGPLPGLPGNIRIQVQGARQGLTVRTSVVNGHRKVDVDDGTKKTHIEVTPEGAITVETTETVDGQDKTSKVEAKNADELKKKDAEAFKLYEKFGKNAGVGLQIQALPVFGGVIPPAPPQANGDVAKAREALGKARQQLAEAVTRLEKLDPAQVQPEDIQGLKTQLQQAQQRLEEIEKNLGAE